MGELNVSQQSYKSIMQVPHHEFVFSTDGGEKISAAAAALLNPPSIMDEVFLGSVPPPEGGWPILLIQVQRCCFEWCRS